MQVVNEIKQLKFGLLLKTLRVHTHIVNTNKIYVLYVLNNKVLGNSCGGLTFTYKVLRF